MNIRLKKPQTLRERIVDFIKDSIVSGSLKPGERVPEQEIAANFGISRTPIREAFRQLESEGFITVTPRKGAIVSPITDKDVSEFYAIKSLLEGYGAASACPKLQPKDIKRLESLNAHMEKAAARGDVKGFFNLDSQFHDTFLTACGNEKLLALVHQLVGQFERFRITALALPGAHERLGQATRRDRRRIQGSQRGPRENALVMANAERSGGLLVEDILKERTKYGAH